jgi:hypothetical protein
MKDLAVVETILRNRYHFFIEIRDGISLQEKILPPSFLSFFWRP